MYPPVLVTAPTSVVVELDDLKGHLRVEHDDEDALIAALEAAAVAHFDGWRGVLGRAVMPQTWSQQLDSWGCHRLAFPDAEVTAVVGILDGVETAATEFSTEVMSGGVYVTAQGDTADRIKVTFTASLPAEQLPAVQMAVKLLVGHWYENREAATEKALSAAPMAVQALVAPLRVQGI